MTPKRENSAEITADITGRSPDLATKLCQVACSENAAFAAERRSAGGEIYSGVRFTVSNDLGRADFITLRLDSPGGARHAIVIDRQDGRYAGGAIQEGDLTLFNEIADRGLSAEKAPPVPPEPDLAVGRLIAGVLSGPEVGVLKHACGTLAGDQATQFEDLQDRVFLLMEEFADLIPRDGPKAIHCFYHVLERDDQTADVMTVRLVAAGDHAERAMSRSHFYILETRGVAITRDVTEMLFDDAKFDTIADEAQPGVVRGLAAHFSEINRSMIDQHGRPFHTTGGDRALDHVLIAYDVGGTSENAMKLRVKYGSGEEAVVSLLPASDEVILFSKHPPEGAVAHPGPATHPLATEHVVLVSVTLSRFEHKAQEILARLSA